MAEDILWAVMHYCNVNRFQLKKMVLHAQK